MARRAKAEKPIEPEVRLRLFVDRARWLGTRRLVEDLTANMTLIFRPDTRVRAHKVKVVDEDDLLAYLSALRPFLLNDDAVFLDRALKVAAAHVTDPKMQGHIDAIRTQWSAAQKDRSMQYVVGEQELTPRDVFLLYVNARFFHVPDPEAIELLRRVDDPALPPFGPYMLMEFAITTHNTVAAAARVFNAAVSQGVVSSQPVRRRRIGAADARRIADAEHASARVGRDRGSGDRCA